MKNLHKLFFVAIIGFFSCTDDPGKGTPDFTVAYHSIPGVDANLLSLDIYNEGITGPAPVVIWIHGGGWSIGDKLQNMEFKETLCRNNNYILVSVNYRLSNGANGIAHPAHVQDVAKAIVWVYQNIHTYAGDSSKIVVMGHSAGAHLAALVCTDETYLQAEGYDFGIIDGCGSFDTEAYDIPTSMANGNEDNALYINAFTNNSSVWQNASPKFHVSPGKNIPPYFLLARRGGSGRQQICNDFAGTLNNSGINANVIDASSLTHEQVNERIGFTGDEIMTTSVLNFLQVAFN